MSRISRRQLLAGLGAAGCVSLSGQIPGLWRRAMLDAAESARSDDRILVLVQLAGGNDGLNTLVPFTNDVYYRGRPAVAIAKDQVLKLNDRCGLHPAMGEFRRLYDEGRLAIVEGVGYPQPDRSHFRSMDIWQSAMPSATDFRDGWIGRALDRAFQQDPTASESLALGTDRTPLSLLSQTRAVPAIVDFQQYRTTGATLAKAPTRRPLEKLAAGASGTSELDFLRRGLVGALETADRLGRLGDRNSSTETFPATGMGRKLQTISQLIAADFPARVYFVSLDGFDTHAQQLTGHQALLAELSDAVGAFAKELDAHRRSDQVVLLTFSEFGRRVAENGSLGTDHGAASVLFALTPPGHGGFHGKPPSFDNLDDGDLIHTVDFRSVYATVLDRWLGIPSREILAGEFVPVPFLPG